MNELRVVVGVEGRLGARENKSGDGKDKRKAKGQAKFMKRRRELILVRQYMELLRFAWDRNGVGGESGRRTEEVGLRV